MFIVSVLSYQVLEELKVLVEYYEKETGESAKLLAVGVSSRKNLCIHPEVCFQTNWLSHIALGMNSLVVLVY